VEWRQIWRYKLVLDSFFTNISTLVVKMSMCVIQILYVQHRAFLEKNYHKLKVEESPELNRLQRLIEATPR
jgi:hypothetical protein